MNELIKKYPWISFTSNLTKIPYSTWIKIGECLSKIEHISNVPLKPDAAKEMHMVYLVKGVQATTAIEGNTLSEEEVRKRIEEELQLPPSKEYLGKEVDNVLFLCNQLKNEKIPNEDSHDIIMEDIMKYNKKILENIPLPEHVLPGKLRTYPVGVGGYKAPNHSDVLELFNQYCDWLNSNTFNIFEKQPVLNSIIKAIIAHLYFAWIHPFGDGNGRTARIIEFYILLSSGIPTPAVHLLSNHYNDTRTEYYRQLDQAGKSKDATNFIGYAVQGFLDGLRSQLSYIFKLVIHVSWESYVYEEFNKLKHHAETTKRRRNLILAISNIEGFVNKTDVTTLNKIVIDSYKNKTEKTLSRDIKALIEMDLIEVKDKGIRAKKEIISAFKPLRLI